MHHSAPSNENVSTPFGPFPATRPHDGQWSLAAVSVFGIGPPSHDQPALAFALFGYRQLCRTPQDIHNNSSVVNMFAALSKAAFSGLDRTLCLPSPFASAKSIARQ
jgi:hypothetical protein